MEPTLPPTRPILWSFRRCPYAIRARLALAAAGLRPGVDLELREVDLGCRPPELLELWPAGTVPLLQLAGGEAPPAGGQEGGEPMVDQRIDGEHLANRVLGESLEIMHWALAQRDPLRWLALPADTAGGGSAAGDGTAEPHGEPGRPGQRKAGLPSGSGPLPAPIAALIAENDGPFKHHLDRFKYPERYPGEEPERHRRAGLAILRGWESLLRPGEPTGLKTGETGARAMGHGAGVGERGDQNQPTTDAARRRLSGPGGASDETAWPQGDGPQGRGLLGPRLCLADMALLPFVRQFRLADPEAFDADPGLPALRAWLQRFEASEELAAVMAPPWAFRQPWRSRRWIYHLALSEEWRQARDQGEYRRSTRGLSLEQVGFIHASYPHQIAATHGRFYGDAGPVRLLTIDPARLAALGIEVLEEEAAEGTGERFPHIHGPLPISAVLAAEAYRP